MEKNLKAFFYSHWGAVAACLLTIFAFLPLFQPGFFPMHDDEQVGRLYDLDLALKSGHIPPRIAPNLGFGYGYPLFNFYPSFVYYIAEIFVLLGFSYIMSIKLMIATGFIATSFFMYLFSRKFLGEIGGVVAAVAYTYAPYHAVDVYVRGALPEFWSFAFIPAICWAITELQETAGKRYVIYTALFIAGLILTHNLVALMSSLFFFVYGLYLLVRSEHKMRFLRQSVFGVIFGFLLSAYFWIPSYFERKFTMIELLTTELADYSQHFVYLRQLWHSPWGYGGSLFGLDDGMSFEVGKLHLIGSLLLLGILFSLWKERHVAREVLTIFFWLFLFSIFMISFYSEPVWDAIPQLAYIQFSWRFLLFAAFTASFLLGGLLLLPLKRMYRLFFGATLIVLIIALNVSFFTPAKYLTEVTDQDYISHEVIRWRTSIMAFEYVPRGIATRTSPIGTTVIDIEPDQVAKDSYTIQKGNMTVITRTDAPHEKILEIDARESGTLQLNTFAFPGWKVFLNDREISYTDTNPFKLITVSVPEGRSTLHARFTDTKTRQIGNVLSVVGIIGILLYGMVNRGNSRHIAKKKALVWYNFYT